MLDAYARLVELVKAYGILDEDRQTGRSFAQSLVDAGLLLLLLIPAAQRRLDVGSGQFLVAVAILLIAFITALSMVAVARTHADVGVGSEDEGATRSQEAD